VTPCFAFCEQNGTAVIKYKDFITSCVLFLKKKTLAVIFILKIFDNALIFLHLGNKKRKTDVLAPFFCGNN